MPDVVQQSVENLPPIEQSRSSIWLLGESHTRHSDILSPFGTKRLDQQLRAWSRNMWGSLWMGGRQKLAKTAASTPWIVKGNRRVNAMQTLLQSAEWGGGWQYFIEMLVRDFTTYNIGAIVEIVGHGKTDKPLLGPPIGIKLLDPLRCWLTGIPDTPICYENFWIDATGEQRTSFHFMHESRVHRIVDMPDSDERLLGIGESAFYRYIGHHYRQILINKYTVERLSDQPPAGFLVMGNVKQSDVTDATKLYEGNRATEGQTVWRNIQTLQSVDRNSPIDVQFINFSNLPENFNFKEYMEVDVRIAALSLGIDPQDIWPLGGQLAGTAEQSRVLSEKSKGQSIGLIYKYIETMLNTKVLPPSAEFEFKPEDTETALKNAQRAQAWTTVAVDPGVPADQMERRQLLANTVDEWRDVLTDQDGIVTLPDVDPKDESQQGEVQVEDTQDESVDEDAAQAEDTGNEQTKEYLSTRKRFISRVADALQAAQQRDISRTRFGIIMRGHLAREGRRAYMDGLSDGGVEVNVLEGEDKARFNAWMAEQSAFVTELGRSIYKRDAGVFFDSARRADTWGNKSLNPLYQEALGVADKNGLYQWALGSTKEHCKTCRTADGQIHRMKEWIRAGVLPQGSRLICKGYQCKCTLTRVRGRARGRLRRIPREAA
jgi:hypothetical protein